MSQCLEEGFYDKMEQKTQRFVAQLQAHCNAKGYPVTIPTIGSIFWIAFTQKVIRRADQIDPVSMDKFKAIHSELLDNGIYLGPSGYEVGFISAAHTVAELDAAAILICAALDIAHS